MKTIEIEPEILQEIDQMPEYGAGRKAGMLKRSNSSLTLIQESVRFPNNFHSVEV